jgi:hypothetical protein
LGGAASGACGHESHKVEIITLEENQAKEGQNATQAGRPRPAGLPYKTHLPVLVYGRQATLTSLCLCARVFSPEPP